MKRKRRGSIFMAAVLMAVSLAMTPIAAHAEHRSPITGQPCDGNYWGYEHTGVAGAYQTGAHMHSNGLYCTITCVGYYHNIRCAQCGFTQSGVIIGCEENHSLCGNTTVKHP